jgi:hypothetical protein
MPFLSTIVFFFIGVFYNAWHPGWLVFLLIPVTGILSRDKISFRALAFFIILTIIILTLSFGPFFAVPMWSLFLLLIPFEKSQKTKPFRIYAMIYTFFAVFAYHFLYYLPFFRYLGSGSNVDVPMLQTLPLLMLVPIGIYAFWNGAIKINIDLNWNNKKERLQFFLNAGFILSIFIGYLLIGILFGLWHPGWLIFFLIPVVYIIIKAKKVPFVELMPFIATSLFILVGEYVALPNQESSYALSWLFFLFIPITGILFNERGN